jgi:hypothetical protein
MKIILTLSLILQPFAAFASDSLQYRVSVSSRKLTEVIAAGIYARGGSREGLFFEDLMNSAPAVAHEEIDEFYKNTFPYEINDYYMSVAKGAAKAEGNRQIEAELQTLQDQYNTITADHQSGIHPKLFKQRFIEILHKQFDQRIGLMVTDFNSRLQKHSGDYTAMLTEYNVVLKEIEHQRVVNGFKKVAFAFALGGAGFATVFLGIPLIIPFLVPWDQVTN